MELRTLFIEDNPLLSENLRRYFDGEEFSGNILRAENAISFEEGVSLVEQGDYDLVVLDLQTEGEGYDEMAGVRILDRIKDVAFIPVIFYTGHANRIQDLVSEIVGVVNKGDGFDNLKAEIQRIVDTKIALLKGQVYSHLRESLRKYFWETVDANREVFVPGRSDVSLGYLLLRRLANSLSKENIKEILGDNKIMSDKAHPMEFYIFPSSEGEYEAGEILTRHERNYVLLTPTCDFTLRTRRDNSTYRKVGRVLLARVIPLYQCDEYKRYKETGSKGDKAELKRIIESSKSDRYFFLPGTLFIENSVIDFQNKIMVDYEGLEEFQRLAKLDDPFAQSMISSFIRYYNRIGFPDIDSDYILQSL